MSNTAITEKETKDLIKGKLSRYFGVTKRFYTVVESAGFPHDRHGTVTARNHLGKSARLRFRRHKENIRTGINPKIFQIKQYVSKDFKSFWDCRKSRIRQLFQWFPVSYRIRGLTS